MAKRILAVDDEPSIVKLVTAALTARGYEVSAAYNGEEALDKIALDPPDLIVCDIMMPRMDGREVQRRLAADPKTKKIPFIFLSAIGDMDKQLSTLEEGGAEYLTKPLSPAERLPSRPHSSHSGAAAFISSRISSFTHAGAPGRQQSVRYA